ncbi:hypothetical protein B566_EDAN017193 [Ephemera danica]|nr:hypothetical protein B566_EDAN017193 [Ephemera danica]
MKILLVILGIVGLLCNGVFTLPLVDAGLFVILGVSTCRDGAGYCLLGSDCTLDHDFSPDDTGGHCNGLRAAFTPAANFVCCKYNGATPATTTVGSVTPSSTMVPTSTMQAVTVTKTSPSRRPVINNSKPVSTSAVLGEEPTGAVFWVDLSTPKPSSSNQATKLHPGSDLTVSGMTSPTLVDDNSVQGSLGAALASAMRPGLTVSVPGLVAARPGSAAVDGVLDELVHGIGVEVAHGVSITRDPVTPSLQLEPVGSIEAHEPVTSTQSSKPSAVAVPSKPPKPAKPVKPVTTVPAKPSSTARPTTSAAPEDEEDEDEDEESEEEEEEDEEEDDDDGGGLFGGLADLADLLLGAGTGGAGAGAAKNEVEESSSASTADVTTPASEAAVTESEVEEAPPLCLGPVREPRDPACWAVRFESAGKALCSGARVARDLIVTSAACAVRVSISGSEARALLPGLSVEVRDAVVHENYRAAPHAALNDIGLVRLNSNATESATDLCTLCLPQEPSADFIHGSCLSPRFSEDEVELVSRSTSPRGVCEVETKSRTEDDARFPTLLCATRSTREAGEGAPLVCRGRRSIPVLAGVLMTTSDVGSSPELYTPVGHYVEWIRAHHQG